MVSFSGTNLRVLELQGEHLVEVGTCELEQDYVYQLLCGPGFAATLFYSMRLGSNYQLQFVNLSDPTKPRIAGRLNANFGANLRQSGDHWIGVGREEILVYDFSDLDKPRSVANSA